MTTIISQISMGIITASLTGSALYAIFYWKRKKK